MQHKISFFIYHALLSLLLLLFSFFFVFFLMRRPLGAGEKERETNRIKSKGNKIKYLKQNKDRKRTIKPPHTCHMPRSTHTHAGINHRRGATPTPTQGHAHSYIKNMLNQHICEFIYKDIYKNLRPCRKLQPPGRS